METSPVCSAQLEKTRKQFPFPEDEIRRTFARRWILDYIPANGIGAEIGVFRGYFSEVILDVNKPRKLFLVDPWTKIGEFFSWSDAYTNFGALPTALAKQEVENIGIAFPNTETVIIEDFFPNCIEQIPDRLDWVYLDSSHGYEATLNELRAVTQILSDYGVILGDDWNHDPGHHHHGVFRAIQEFVRETDFVIRAAGPAAQWCLGRRPVYNW